MHGRLFSVALYNKTTNESYIFDRKDYYESLGLSAFIFPVNAYNDEIICSIYIDNINKKSEIKNADLSEIVNNSKPDDNPILCFMKWKK